MPRPLKHRAGIRAGGQLTWKDVRVAVFASVQRKICSEVRNIQSDQFQLLQTRKKRFEFLCTVWSGRLTLHLRLRASEVLQHALGSLIMQCLILRAECANPFPSHQLAPAEETGWNLVDMEAHYMLA